MPTCHINLVLGALPEDVPGQWIEASVSLERTGNFVFTADLCRRLPSGEFSLYRVEVVSRCQFTAKLTRALLALCAEPPFTPTRSGLDVYVDGDATLANGEVARILEPATRLAMHADCVPRDMTEDLKRQLVRLAKQRELQRGISNLDIFDKVSVVSH